MELTDLGARLKIMDEEEIAAQVIYHDAFPRVSVELQSGLRDRALLFLQSLVG